MAATKCSHSDKSSCGSPASHGLPHLSYPLSTRFSQSLCLALLSQPWYLCASVPLILCLFDSLVEEFTPFGFLFSIFQLTTSDHKASLLIKPFVPSLLKISLPLQSFFPGFVCRGCLIFCVFPLGPLARSSHSVACSFRSSCSSCSCLVKRFCFAVAVDGELPEDVQRGTAAKKSCGSQLVPCASPCISLLTCTISYNVYYTAQLRSHAETHAVRQEETGIGEISGNVDRLSVRAES